MTFQMWRKCALALITASSLTTYAVAQNTSGEASAQGSAQSGSAQGSAQGSTQGNTNNQKDASSNTNSESAQRNDNQGSRGGGDSQDQASKNTNSQSDQDRQSTRRSSDGSNTRDGRNSTNTRSDRNADRGDDRGGRRDERSTDNRSDRSDRGRNGDRDSSRRDMRGPDIGLWFNRQSRDGLIIVDVSSKGAIAKFGFREGDRIVSVNGRRIASEAEFIQFLLHSDVERVKVIVIRDNREEVIYVEPAILTREYEYTDVDPLERFGIIVDDRYDDRIVVWRVIPRSPAYYAGFRPGDVVINFGGRPYKSRVEFEKSANEWKEGEVNVQVRRGDKNRELSADVPKYDRSNARISERTDRRVDGAERRTERNDNSRQNTRRPGILGGRR
jgi:PDZ domain-containing protein